MNKLNYKSFADLIAAFNAGAKFQVVGNEMHPSNYGPVTKIVAVGTGINVWVAGNHSPYSSIRLDGTSSYFEGLRMVEVSPAPAATPARTERLVTSVRSVRAPFGTSTVRYDEVTTQPFLKALLGGASSYCKKTGEALDGVVFTKGELTFILIKDGVRRASTNYRHDGTHKHDAERDLVMGTPPAPKTYLGNELFGGRAPEGVYEVKGRDHMYAVASGIGAMRTVLYVDRKAQRVEVLNRHWADQVFTLTNKKFTSAIA